MKKFQKILSAGLILSQMFSSSCIVSANSSDNTKQPCLLIRASEDDSEATVNTNKAKERSSLIIKWALKLARLGLASDVILQLLCAKCPGIALALSKYADDNSEGGFRFSEYVNLDASLNQFACLFYVGLSARNLRTANKYFQIKLICEEITGGWQQAAKIASLGFAKDIYVKHEGGTKFKFYYMPGSYGLTSVDACNYLQHLIQKAESHSYEDTPVDQLRSRLALLQSCISYKMWATANRAVTTDTTETAGDVKTEETDHDDEIKKYSGLMCLPVMRTVIPSLITPETTYEKSTSGNQYDEDTYGFDKQSIEN